MIELVKKHRVTGSILLVIFLILTVVIASFYNSYIQSLILPVEEQANQIITKSEEAGITLSDVDRNIKTFFITHEQSQLDLIQSHIKAYNSVIDTLHSNLTNQKKNFPANASTLDSLIKSLQEAKDTFGKYADLSRDIMMVAENDTLHTIAQFTKEHKEEKPYQLWQGFHNEVSSFENLLVKNAKLRYDASLQNTSWLVLSLLLVGGIALGWVFWETRKNDAHMKQIGLRVETDNRKYIFDPGTPISLNEDDISDETVRNFEKAARFVKEITDGNYDVEWEGLTTDNLKLNTDTLAGRLIKMKSRMQQVKLDDSHRNWINEGLGKLGDILRRESNMTIVADKILSELIRYVGANQGMLFIIDEDEAGLPYLDLKSTYAFNRKKYISKQIKPGEGLAGQVWQEGETIYLKEIPEDYVQIRSGLGGANPNNILVVPLKNDTTLQGVLEIASFRVFEKYQIDFIEKLAETIAVTITNVKVAQHTQKLLEETTHMTQIMKKQEEEMRQNVEELQATQEEIYRNQYEVSQRETILRALFDYTDSAVVALDRNLNVLAFNKQIEELYASTGIKIETGINIKNILAADQFALRKSKFERALSGEIFKELYETHAEKTGETLYFEESYYPIRNEASEIAGFSIYSDNITKDYILRQNIEQKQAIMEATINNTDDNVLALDSNYKVLLVNNGYRKRYAEQGIDYREGMSVFEILDPAIRAEWKEYYDRALAGEKFRLEKSYEHDGKVTSREYFFNPILNSSGDIMGLSIFNRLMK
jgi:PAS domain S-box-containing protein